MAAKKPKLTERQKRFIDYYVKFGNATQAAIQAGYSKKNAGRIGEENRRKPHISEAIRKRTESLSRATIADATEILEYLTAVLRGEATDIALYDGIELTVGVGSGDRIKAAQLLGKRYGIFIDRIEGNIKVENPFQDLSKEELLTMASNLKDEDS